VKRLLSRLTTGKELTSTFVCRRWGRRKWISGDIGIGLGVLKCPPVPEGVNWCQGVRRFLENTHVSVVGSALSISFV